MGILARLNPRHWGGRRVLQFLTGLALVALTFVAVLDVPAASTGPTVVTAAAPVDLAPGGLDATAAECDAARAGEARAGEAGAQAGEAETGQVASGHAEPVAAMPGAPDVVLQLTAVSRAAATPPTGLTPASLGSRAPPLR